MAAFRFDARVRAVSVSQSLERIRNRNARVTSIIHRHHIVRPRSIRQSVSFVVRRSWNTRSFENIDRSLVSSASTPRNARADTIAGDADDDATTRRRDETRRDTNRGINRKTYHARAKSSTDARRFASLQTRRQVRLVGTERPKPKLLCGSICMYKQL